MPFHRWESNPDTVTHPSTNRAQRRLTSLIEINDATTTPRRHLVRRVIVRGHTVLDVTSCSGQLSLLPSARWETSTDDVWWHCVHYYYYYVCLGYGDGVGNSVFSIIWMRWLLSARASSKILLQQNHQVLNWACCCCYSIITITITIRPHRLHTVHEMRPVATDAHIAWSVCMCVGHTGELCKNG